MINVTSFFRNPEGFDILKTKVFPRLLRERSRHDPVRIWVLGCSTGEEAYSIAMTFTEVAEESGFRQPMQLFATDLNADGVPEWVGEARLIAWDGKAYRIAIDAQPPSFDCPC